MQTKVYEGHFTRACQLFTAGRTVVIPEQRRVVITVFDEPPAQEAIQTNSNRIDKRLAIVQSLRGVLPHDINLEVAKAERRVKRGLVD